jgi:hypothetical protein
VRVTTALKRLLALDAVNVTAVEFGPSMIVVSVALRRRRLECPHCDYSTQAAATFADAALAASSVTRSLALPDGMPTVST